MKVRTPVILLLGALIALMCAGSAFADGTRQVYGSIGIETPVGADPDRPQDDSPAVIADLRLPEFFGPVGVFLAGEVKTRKGLPWSNENKFKAGLELPLGGSGLVAYSYFERRFCANKNRVMGGVRWKFAAAY